jgi:hypothetical protein
VTLLEISCGRSGIAAGLYFNFAGFPLLIIIPPLFCTRLSPPPGVFYSPAHAAQYHIRSLQVRGSFSAWTRDWLQDKEV